MKEAFSKTWNKSKQPRKQRKYRYNAPLHIRGKFMNVHLSSELKKKYDKRNVRVRVGDKVKILRGKYKGREEKVERVDLKKEMVFLSKIDLTKKDGTKIIPGINPSNLLITELNTDDKKRFKKLSFQKTKQKIEPEVKETKNESKPKKEITKNG
ncbi:MAG: 50S ribosomal protein L24 [Nanoarchaeota archaeon]|nr:50S ribosomal protein L24 [Nanoarchaeota archaeon]MBU1030518.1 50S ribosomal protein L24 [Nanoarchaeota archaeon]